MAHQTCWLTGLVEQQAEVSNELQCPSHWGLKQSHGHYLVDGEIKLAQQVLLHALPFVCFSPEKRHITRTQTDRHTNRQLSHKHPTLRQLVLKYTPSKATQLLVSSTERRFRKAYLALGPTAAEDLSYRVQEVTAEPCSSVSAATAPVSAMMVSKKEVSSAWLVSKGRLPT